MEELVNKTLGQFQIRRELGRGGMAVVYEAYQPTLQRRVALKVLPPSLSYDAEFVRRFRHEAIAAANLRHPNIVTIYDAGSEGPYNFIAMELLEGRSLSDLIRATGPMPLARVAKIIEQVAQALDYAHKRGFVHRDIKPSNVMVAEDDHATLTDFGIAKALSGTRLTQTGMSVGTPEYMSPEQVMGEEVDGRTDVYSLGIVAYEMLTGQVPFSGTTASVLYKQAHEPPPPLRTRVPGISPTVESAIMRALVKRRDERYATASQLAQTLAAAVAGRPLPAMPQPVPATVAVPPPQPVYAPPQPAYVPPPAAPRASGLLWLGIGLGVVVLLCAVVAGVVLLSGAQPRPNIPIVTDVPSRRVTVTLSPTARSPGLTYTPTATPRPSGRVQVPAGGFFHGSTSADLDRVVSQLCPAYQDAWCKKSSFEDELLRSEVPKPSADVFYVERHDDSTGSFYIDPHEVTNAEYAACVKAGACSSPATSGANPRHAYFAEARRANYPVVYVTWFDAATYCEWAGARLPTAQEWEKAARGTDGRWWPWGNQAPTNEANFRHPGQSAADDNAASLTGNDLAPVGSYSADTSPYGALDMAGNVMEWVDAWYGPEKREIRGGSWNTGSFSTRAANRAGSDPRQSYFDIGFRCARDRP